MPDRVHPALLAVLTPEERDGLLRALDMIGQELANLYADEVDDHSEARGDNGQLFGMKLWVHGWFRYEDLFVDDPVIEVVADNGSWALHIGRLRVGIYRQGSHVDDDIHHDIPHADSETKRSYGVRNAAQLSLFPESVARPTIDDASVGTLHDLTITHFGNSREALVKWYVGAQSQPGRWAWVLRQPEVKVDRRGQTSDGVTSIRSRPQVGGDIVPFDQRPITDVPVVPHRPAIREQQTDDNE